MPVLTSLNGNLVLFVFYIILAIFLHMLVVRCYFSVEVSEVGVLSYPFSGHHVLPEPRADRGRVRDAACRQPPGPLHHAAPALPAPQDVRHRRAEGAHRQRLLDGAQLLQRRQLRRHHDEVCWPRRVESMWNLICILCVLLHLSLCARSLFEAFCSEGMMFGLGMFQ